MVETQIKSPHVSTDELLKKQLFFANPFILTSNSAMTFYRCATRHCCPLVIWRCIKHRCKFVLATGKVKLIHNLSRSNRITVPPVPSGQIHESTEVERSSSECAAVTIEALVAQTIGFGVTGSFTVEPWWARLATRVVARSLKENARSVKGQ